MAGRERAFPAVELSHGRPRVVPTSLCGKTSGSVGQWECQVAFHKPVLVFNTTGRFKSVLCTLAKFVSVSGQKTESQCPEQLRVVL